MMRIPSLIPVIAIFLLLQASGRTRFATARPVTVEFNKTGIYRQVPVLCYHNIRKKPPVEDELWISDSMLNCQLRMLADSGYQSVLPGDLYRHLTLHEPLPLKPVIITFDDGHKQHFTTALPLLAKYGFRAVFFISSVYIGRKGQMDTTQVKALVDSGHVVGCHTFDHPDLSHLKYNQWHRELDSCKNNLGAITASPVEYFAYPYGIWNDSAIAALKMAGFKAAFQLTGKASAGSPLFTLRRIAVSGKWTPADLNRQIRHYFEQQLFVDLLIDRLLNEQNWAQHIETLVQQVLG